MLEVSKVDVRNNIVVGNAVGALYSWIAEMAVHI